jgi:hypothetical protein
MRSGTFVASPTAGAQADFDARKAEVDSGIFYVGPGLEALVLGLFGPNVSLMRVTNTGIYAISRLHVADGTDPTKLHRFDASAISPGIVRVGALPDWDGVHLLPADFGALGQFLKSNGPGAQPSWGAGGGVHNLLDGSVHPDTVAQAVLRGALVVGNSTPKWDRLAIGAANTFLKSDGSDPSWASAAAIAALLAHTALLQVSEFTVTNCKLTNASGVIQTSGGGFLAAKIGARVVVGSQPDTAWTVLPTVQSVDTDQQITVNQLYQGGTTGFTETVRVIYNDHTQYLLKDGFGSETDGTAPQQLWGNIEWKGNRRNSTGGRFIVEAGSLANNFYGFGIRDTGRGSIAFFDCLALSASANFLYRFPNIQNGINGAEILVAGSTATFQNGAVAARQTVDSKDFTTGVSYQMDGTATYGVFRTAGGADRLSFDMSAVTALRSARWADAAGTVAVEPAVATISGATPSVATGRTFKVTNGGATNMTAMTADHDGQEVVLLFTNGNTTMKDSSTTGTFELLGSVDFNPAANTVMKFVRVNADSKWYEVSRSAN